MREAQVEAERTSVSVAEARALILDSVTPLGTETVGLASMNAHQRSRYCVHPVCAANEAATLPSMCQMR